MPPGSEQGIRVHSRGFSAFGTLAERNTLPEVRGAAGRASLVTTGGYLHIRDDDAVEGRLFSSISLG
jgi:hypothetical protein